MGSFFDKSKFIKPEIKEKEDNLLKLVENLKHWSRKEKQELMNDAKDSLVKFLQMNYSGKQSQ